MTISVSGIALSITKQKCEGCGVEKNKYHLNTIVLLEYFLKTLVSNDFQEAGYMDAKPDSTMFLGAIGGSGMIPSRLWFLALGIFYADILKKVFDA